MRHELDAAVTFTHFLADNRVTRFPSNMEIVRSNDGGEVLEEDFGAL